MIAMTLPEEAGTSNIASLGSIRSSRTGNIGIHTGAVGIMDGCDICSVRQYAEAAGRCDR